MDKGQKSRVQQQQQQQQRFKGSQCIEWEKHSHKAIQKACCTILQRNANVQFHQQLLLWVKACLHMQFQLFDAHAFLFCNVCF